MNYGPFGLHFSNEKSTLIQARRVLANWNARDNPPVIYHFWGNHYRCLLPQSLNIKLQLRFRYLCRVLDPQQERQYQERPINEIEDRIDNVTFYEIPPPHVID